MADAKPLYDTYNRVPIVFERGHGVWLETPEGERYLDFAAGIAVNSLGHTHPHLVEALKAQADRLWHLSNVHEIPDQSRMAERLTEVTFHQFRRGGARMCDQDRAASFPCQRPARALPHHHV